MGLIYQFPIKEGESPQIEEKEGGISLGSYGLPMIFWGYLAAFLSVLLIMFLAVKNPLYKMLTMDDYINQKLALLMIITFVSLPLIAIGFFFYQKNFYKRKNLFSIQQKVFGLPFQKKELELSTSNPFSIVHSLETPNMAKIHNEPEMRAFQNQGYFELFGNLSNGSKVLLDRNNRKSDLNRIIEIFNKY
ncbi:MAG: hypothetical protein HN509_06300 [Halobacteriovoraceae bacterium]|nr:hypothetical protein [Halobacteriovoraceae bacterium]MBT5094001.1 hypothetical protein [Halobacteriovoraceae bacterium]